MVENKEGYFVRSTAVQVYFASQINNFVICKHTFYVPYGVIERYFETNLFKKPEKPSVELVKYPVYLF